MAKAAYFCNGKLNKIGSMSFWAQVKLLIWKNFIIRRRQKLRLLIEIVWPLLLFLILMWVRTRGLKSYMKECHFDEKALPSAGVIPFLQTFYCSFTNPCHSTVKSASESRLNSSQLLQLTSELEAILQSNINKGVLDSFNLVKDDIYYLHEIMNKASSNISSIQVSDKTNLASLMSESPDSAFKKHNLTFSFDTNEVLRFTDVSVLSLIDVFLSNTTLNTKSFFCDQTLFHLVVTSANKPAIEDIRTALCKLSTFEQLALIFDLTKGASSYSVIEKISKVIETNTGQGLNVVAWVHLIELFTNVTNEVTKSEAMKDSLTSANSSISKMISGFQSNPTVFLNKLFCGREMTYFNQTQTATNGLAKLDEMGRKFHFRVVKQDKTEKEDNATSDACKMLFATFQDEQFTKLIWRQVKPFVRGKILYTPDTPAAAAIMAKVNETFSIVGDVLALTEEWLENLSPGLRAHFINTSTTLELLQNSTNPELIRQNAMLQRAWEFYLAFLGRANPSVKLENDPTIAKLHSYFINNTLKGWAESLDRADQIAKFINSFLQCFDMDKIEAMPTEDEAVGKGIELITVDRLWAVIVFENLNFTGNESDTVLPTHVRYKIRMDADKVDSTKRLEDRIPTPGSRSNPFIDLKYIAYGFAYLQDLVERAIIQEQTGFESLPGVWVQQFPYPCYIHDQFILAISRTFPMFMVLSWVYTSAMIIKTVVHEKEKRLKEVMKVMGLGNGVHWLGWYINSFVIMLITVISLTLILKYGNILESSDPSIIFIFLMLYMSATITKSFLISTFFSKANIAAATGGICFFILYLPYPFMVIWEEELKGPEKALASLLSNVAFGFGCSYFAHYEESGIGMQWNNLHKSPLLGDSYSMSKCMIMLSFDSILYSFLTFYIETVAPGQYGVPKPWYFLFTRSYWCRRRTKQKPYALRHETDEAFEMRNQNLDPNFEKNPLYLKMGVQIQHLRKVYKNGKVAVDDLSLNFYEDQITSFLGHNGAGKTTTISILTGLFPPSDGTATIYDLDIRNDMDAIRKSLGTCPQHNVLFDHLTVEEHLWFYGCLKGRGKTKVEIEVTKMLTDIGLPHKKKELSRNLSGGMQRKLSIAIAFIGGSKTVILDEPTAGVDPYSRRSIWELLLKYKKGRTIILTTHYMDEADLLGDRIAIISDGRVRCCGSSLFLKRHFGNGYYLTLVRSDPSNVLEEVDLAQFMEKRRSWFKAEVTSFIMSHIPCASLVEDVGMELVYVLPTESKEGRAFEKLFDALDRNLESLGIASYGISDSTLEEIFLKVASTDRLGNASQNGNIPTRTKLREIIELPHMAINSILKLQSGKVNSVPADLPKTLDSHVVDEHDGLNGSLTGETGHCLPKVSPKRQSPKKYTPVTGWRLIQKQVFALHVKRFHHTRRDFKGLFCEIILPALFVCLALAFTLILPPFRMEPPLQLHPWLYGPPNFVFFRYKPCLEKASTVWHPNISVPFNKVVPCSCKIGAQTCPADAGGPPLPALETRTSDVLLNVTTRNITDWLLKTEQEYYKRRFGGVTFGLKSPLAGINITLFQRIFDRLSKAANLGQPVLEDSNYVFKEFDRGMRDLPIFGNLKIWFNNRGWAAMVSYINAINNVILRAHLPPDQDPSSYGITAINHPLNFTSDQVQMEVLRRSGISLLHAICVIFAMSFVPASFILYLIEDKVSKSQHLQFVTGVSPLTYWIANNIWDNINYLMSASLCVLIFIIFDEQAYVSPANLPGLVLLLVLYGWASIPMMYPASFIFNIPSTAFVVLASGNLFVGVVSTIATFILEVMDDKELQDIADILKQVFLIFPHCLNVERYPLSWNFLGRNLLCMFIQGIIFFSCTLLLQYKFLITFKQPKLEPKEIVEDDDIARERALVLSGQFDSSVLKITNLTKIYRIWKGNRSACCRKNGQFINLQAGQLLAVDRLCVGVKSGECFGLLGVNGAGKTTTFKMLTQDTTITSGDAYVNGYSIRTEMNHARSHIGYCPQFDALDNLLTGEEHLRFYARLRGIPDDHAREVVNKQLSKLSLVDHAKKCAGMYSGGNKRKLSTAIALIGNPSLVFLDEPTTGMDPHARRFLWNSISDLMKEGRSVVLTSHSLEECEALCTRLAIMVNGRLQCLGSIQHLKNKFGSGYTLTVRVSGLPQDLDLVKAFILETFPSAKVQEEHHIQLVFHLPSQGLALSNLFHHMEENKSRLRVEDYSVCQTTLDQVFINFAKRQTHLLEDE